MARDGFVQVLRGEWTKFWSVRSTAWCLVLGAGLLVLISTLAAAGGSTTANDTPGDARRMDQFHFVHQPLAGDGTLTAQVLTQQDTGPWASAGIMLKESTRPGSRYAAVAVTSGHGVRLRADFTTDLAGSASGAPRWLRLTRTGSSVTGYESPDGTDGSWRPVGTVDLAGLPATVEAGLFVTSPADGQFVVRRGVSTRVGPRFAPTTATFGDVSLAPVAPPASTGASWRGENIGPVAQRPDGTTLAGSASQVGDTFTVTGVGDVRTIPPAELGNDDVVRNALTGVSVSLIAIIVLGTIVITTEYAKGVIRTTFAASPRRGRVLAAKAVVLGTVTFAAGLVGSVAAFVLAQPLLRAGGFAPPAYPEVSLADGPALRAVVGTALVLAVLALFSLGLGAILRRSAGVITIMIMLLVVPGVLTGLLPLEVEKWVYRLTPIAGLAIQHTRADRYDNWIAPWAGFGVLCGYAAIVLATAFVLLRRRDA